MHYFNCKDESSTCLPFLVLEQKLIGLHISCERFLLFTILLILGSVSHAQTRSDAAEVYFGFGTNTSFYSKSDIYLRSNYNMLLDVKLHDVRGRDDRGLTFNGGAPQYNVQLGIYYPEKRWGAEFGFDHIKYFVRQNQQVDIEGIVNGTYKNIDTVLTPNLLQLEHSDGANYAIFKLVKRLSLSNKSNTDRLNLLIKAGAGPVIPKTNSTVLGKHRDDRYHIAGYVIAFESGLLYQFSKHVFSELNVKAAYANYRHILIADGYGSQQWHAVHFALLLGYKI